MTEPYGFKTVEHIMAPVIQLMDLIIKLIERIFKKGKYENGRFRTSNKKI